MPIPQGVPNSIGTLAYPITQGLIGSVGPYLSGTNLFYLSVEQPASLGNGELAAFRSTDDGVTFTRIPAPGITIDVGTQQTCISYDRIGDDVYIGYLDGATDNVKLIIFTMGPGPTDGTWGTPSDTGINDTNVGRLWAVNTGTSAYVAWQHSNTDVYYAYFNGATWSSRITIGGVLNKQILALTLASSGKAIVWWGPTGSGPNEVFYTVVNGASVVSTATALDLTSGDQEISNFGSQAYSAYYDSASDSSILALPMTTISTGVQFQAILIATPSASPAFSLVTVATLNVLDLVGRPFLIGNYTGDLFFLLWGQTLDSSGEALLQFSKSTSLAGPWDSADIYYDLQANPPTPNPVDDVVDIPNANFLADDRLGVVIGLTQFISPPPMNWCGILYTWPPEALVPPVTTQTLELTKIISGGPAVPGDFGLEAVGGSPEVEISGNGHVGPTEVSPGTYELAEVAFPDVTWDEETQTWANTPATWGGNYSQGNWDCGGAFMPTPNSVVVAAGSGVDPGIHAMQVASDPTYRALLSGGTYQFHVGPSIYQVLFNAVGKLGIFRRPAGSSGGSWTLLDSIHAPNGLSGYGAVTQRDATIAVAYLDPSNAAVRIVEFDTSTNTWGTPTTSFALPATMNQFGFVRRSDNAYVIVGAWASHWFYTTNAAGIWSLVTNISNLAGTVFQALIDSSDQIWFLVNYEFALNPAAVGLYPLSSGFVLGSAVANRELIFQGPPYPYRFYPTIAFYGPTALAFAYSTAVAPDDLSEIRVSIVRNITTAPVLTDFRAYINLAGQQSFLLNLVEDGGVLNLFWVNTDAPRNQIYQSHWDDPFNWTSPTVFYDAVSDPPPPSGLSPTEFSALQALRLAAGWTAGVTMQTTGPVSTGEFIEVVSPTNNVSCQIVNTFIPTPPPPPPPGGGGGNAVGCFELLRVDVTLMPSRHLPSRGSVK